MKEEFKAFVRRNPNLVNYIRDKKMTWQQFYEIYDLYGENSDIWDNFKDNKATNNSNIINTIKELFTLFKGIDLNSVQKTLSSIDKAIEAVKGINNNTDSNNYDERPKYKYFED